MDRVSCIFGSFTGALLLSRDERWRWALLAAPTEPAVALQRSIPLHTVCAPSAVFCSPPTTDAAAAVSRQRECFVERVRSAREEPQFLEEKGGSPETDDD